MKPTAGIRDIVLGMPHRGRLNLLTDLLQYPSAALFHKVKGNSEFPPDVLGSGDVLSHIGRLFFDLFNEKGGFSFLLRGVEYILIDFFFFWQHSNHAYAGLWCTA